VAATETVVSNQSGETLDCGFKQADGSRQYLTQMFFLSVLLLPAAYLSRDSVLTAGKNPLPEAKGFALK
jgi:hypothetical protein